MTICHIKLEHGGTMATCFTSVFGTRYIMIFRPSDGAVLSRVEQLREKGERDIGQYKVVRYN